MRQTGFSKNLHSSMERLKVATLPVPAVTLGYLHSSMERLKDNAPLAVAAKYLDLHSSMERLKVSGQSLNSAALSGIYIPVWRD